ncbi:hypothetical protein LCGC14_1721950 [marine sediment metagenome]|uniref:PD-(D/E)XK endonuclease-like domain-containing protein n=1 Tax=marine sediment metagenome TaxID=412755 RepID=A0A0F9KBV8_9ZZZZ
MKTQIYPSTKLRTISTSKLNATSCDRYYFWQWVLNLVPKKLNMSFWFGTVMHAAFDAMANPKLHKKIYKIMDEASRTELSKYALVADDSSEIQLQLAIAKTIIKLYLDEYSNKIIQLDNIQTEVSFATKLTESPVMCVGTIDAYGTEKQKIIMIERKTAKIISDDFFALLKFDVQINIYAHAIKNEISGKYPARCDYTAFRKPQIRVNKNETAAKFMVRLEADLHKRKEWYYVTFKHKFGKRSISEVVTDIEQATLSLYLKYKRLTTEQLLSPYNWPRRRSHCLWYGVCPYIILCKNCDKYPLYLRLFQQRELRYKLEHDELSKKPLTLGSSKMKGR